MKLHKLLKDVVDTNLQDTEITFVTSDSRKVCEGCIFVCIKGNNFDGHDVAGQMLDKGAVCVICEKDLSLDNQIIVDDTRYTYALLCANWFSRPDLKMKIVGVTGTNGKTTITTVLKNVITKCSYKVGLIGTSQNEIGNEVIHAQRTTPESFELFELLQKMQSAGCEYVVMEVSSQGLEQRRVGPLHFAAAVFTNLTQDHLDVHGTMENYYLAKKKIFDTCDFAIVNVDDEAGRRYFSEINCEKYSYSIDNCGDFYADCIKLSAQGSTFWFSDNVKSYYVNFSMPGFFNVSNATAVIATCQKLGLDIPKVISYLTEFKGVKGRAEVIPTGRDFTVICDYAHTPDALENILPNVRHYTKGRLVCLFGCGGNRDKKKRPLMAKSAAENCDYMVITSDNPRNEDPDEIIKDILEGIKDTKTPYVTITDRREAIYYAVKNAKKDDVVVLAGKGHEDYQILAGNRKIHFDEREVVSDALKRLD